MLLILLFLATVVAASPPDSVQVYVPLELIHRAIGKALPAIEEQLDTTVLPTCCWNNVVKQHVHLNFLDMSINSARIGTILNVSDSGKSTFTWA